MRKLNPGLRSDLLWGVGAVCVTLLVAMWALGAWGHVRTEVPAYYGGTVPSRFSFDLNAHAIFLQSLLETGSYQHHERLGAPFGLELYDFPLGTENAQWLMLSLLSVAAKTVGALMNVYLLLTFALVALAAYASFRLVGLARPTSLGASVLFAILPYHFLRGEYHLLLSNYASVPAGAVLTILLLRGDSVFPKTDRRRLGTRRLTGRALLMIAACVAIGSWSFYYAALTVLLLVLSAPLAALLHRRLAPLGIAAVLCAVIGTTVVANTAPSLAYWADHGRNAVTAQRAPAEAELYSLKLTHLVLPSRYHRLDVLADLSQRYTDTEYLSDEATATLGAVATLGFLWLAVFAASAVGGREIRIPRAEHHRAAALGALLAFLIGTTGGLSALISWYGSPQIRAYNRISVFIAFFALMAVGLLLDALAPRLRARGWSRPALTAGAVGLLALGVLDQTSSKLKPDYGRARAAWQSDADFGRAAENMFAPGSRIFQLPVVPFPEFPPVFRMRDYDHAKGVLHTRTLKWSYAGMKGRPAFEWQQQLFKLPPAGIVRAVTAAGFSGLYVDRNGFPPEVAGPFEAEIARVTRRPPAVTSSDNRLALYDLRAYAGRLRDRLGGPRFTALGRQTLQLSAPGLSQVDRQRGS